jgi:hypothetical protein
MHTKFWSENLNHLEDTGVDGSTLEWILNKRGRCGLDSSGSG